MKRFVWFLAGISVLLMVLSLGFEGKVPFLQDLKGGFEPSLAAAKTEATSVYDMDIKPLSTEECARCHFSVFKGIRL